MNSQNNTKDFLNAIFSSEIEGYIEIRAIAKNQRKQYFYTSIDNLIETLPQLNKLSKLGYNLYFGVCPRAEKIGKKDAVKKVFALWADIDCETITKEEALKELKKFPMQPSIIIDSGNGLHAYWLLKEPVEASPEIEGILKGIARVFRDSDKKVFDLSRVMRLPNSLNVKDPKHPKKCKIVSFHPELKYSIESFSNYKAETKTPKNQHREFEGPTGDVNKAVASCNFLQHCRDNAKTLEEPLWLAMITNMARLEGGRELIHEFSKPYPKYTPNETETKIEHALNDLGPYTCNIIREYGFKECPSGGCDVSAPVVLGNKQGIKELIDSNADYLVILNALCKIFWEVEREKWIAYLVEKRKHMSKSAVKKDIIKFLNNRIVEVEEDDKEYFTEEEEKKALELLKSPDLLDKFLETTLKLGLVREDINKLCLYLVYTSRLLEEPISVIVLGQSSSGKSYIANGVLKFFPKSAYFSYSYITPQSLYYLEDTELKNKILVIFERAGSEKADYSIRTFISEKELKILYVTKDPKTGKMVTKEMVKEGPITFVETSSNPRIHNDNLNRVFALYAEESKEKIKAVLEQIANSYSKGKPAGIEEDLRVWQCLQTMLKPHSIRIPFSNLLVKYFPDNNIRVQRDFKRFIAIIEASCLLHQYQRKNDGDYLLANIADYEVAYKTGKVILSQTFKGISPKAEEILEIIKDLRKNKRSFDGFSFIRRDIDPHTEHEPREINRYLKELTNKGYLSVLSGVKGGAYTYSLEGDVKDGISLPTPEELNEMLKELSNYPSNKQLTDNKGLKVGQDDLSNFDQVA